MYKFLVKGRSLICPCMVNGYAVKKVYGNAGRHYHADIDDESVSGFSSCEHG